MSPTTADKVWLIVPLFNEAEVIGDVIREAHRSFPRIVCIDDGSRDNSANVARDAGAVVIQHPINLGQGAALQTGFDYVLNNTAAQYVITFDADGQHDPIEALAMVERAKQEGLAIIYGSRFLDNRTKPGLLKQIVLKTAVLVTRLTVGLKLTDAHNGLRLIRRDALAQINIRQDGMAHASEIVSQLAQTDLPWAEAPVHIRYTDYSRAKGQSLLNSVNILVDLLMR
ncbi:MAG: glycosyltransferase family 2 protein [Bowdeniella nasicola]|nr:glycosyltransferase family 2 protein [Bowdeniella nasicola]